VGEVVDDVEALVVRTPEVFQEKQSIQVHLGHEVVEIDLDRSAVRRPHGGDGRRSRSGYA